MDLLVDKGKEFLYEINNHDDAYPIWRPEFQIAFVLKNKGILRLGEGLKQYSINEGDIFVINSYEIHELKMDSEGMILSLYISPAFMASLYPEITTLQLECKSFLFPPEEQTAFDVIRTDFAVAFQTLNKNETHDFTAILRNKVKILLDDLISNFAVPVTVLMANRTEVREHLHNATDYIDRHYRENITLRDLASKVYLSESYLSQLFTKHIGLTFKEYLKRIRLNYALTLLRGNSTITEIALNSGFTNSNSFIEAFKQIFGRTPGQYRKEFVEQHKQTLLYADNEIPADNFEILMKYARHSEHLLPQTSAEPIDKQEIRINISKPLKTLYHNWNRMINVGYAKDLLNGSLQKQIIQMQREIGFHFARFKGIFDDDMMIYNVNPDGNPVYNFVYVDEVIDFLLSAGLTPFIELSYMPSLLAERQYTFFKRRSIISMPNNMQKWNNLIAALLCHLIEQYGAGCVNQWIINISFNPNLEAFGSSTNLKDYWLLYSQSFRTVKEILPHIRISGPGSITEDMIPQFIDMCILEKCIPDIIGVHAFNAASSDEEETGVALLNSEECFPIAVSKDESYLKHLHDRIKMILKNKGLEHLPIMLIEWNSTFWQRDLCNDTSFKSAYLFKNILENYDRFYAMGYWTVSDFLEELLPSSDVFYGGFGLFTRSGIPKSSYRAFQLLKRMGNKLVFSHDGCFVSSSNESIQIFLYNYSHYDLLYRFRHTTHITQTERYNVFIKKNTQLFYINLSGLLPGKYTVHRYSVGPEGGSAYDAWVKMGAPQKINAEEKFFIECQSYPVLQVESLHIENEAAIKAVLKPHNVQLIILTRQSG